MCADRINFSNVFSQWKNKETACCMLKKDILDGIYTHEHTYLPNGLLFFLK